MSSPEANPNVDPRERAKEAVLAVVRRDDFKRDHPMISSAVSEDILEDAVDAAYRTQFDEERAHFRQKIAALGVVVVQQIRSED